MRVDLPQTDRLPDTFAHNLWFVANEVVAMSAADEGVASWVHDSLGRRQRAALKKFVERRWGAGMNKRDATLRMEVAETRAIRPAGHTGCLASECRGVGVYADPALMTGVSAALGPALRRV